jgi:hypothetical protein
MANPKVSNSTLHYTIIKHVVEHGYAPEPSELAQMLSLSEPDVCAALEQLQEYHGVVLHPNSHRIWVAHPFSMAPTNFYLSSAGGVWWSSCAWCALGAAALLNRDVDITTTVGATDKQVTVRIRGGSVSDSDLWVHFPIPMKNAWDNVIYTCSTMLLFEDEAQIDDWCRIHRITGGDVQPIAKIWEFAKVWYGNHMQPDWKKWTAGEASEIFTRFGLTGRIWELPATDTRF